jgi:hypothetical protein
MIVLESESAFLKILIQAISIMASMLTSGEKLDKIYYCVDCEIVFLFIDDVTDHKRSTGHEMIGQTPLGADESIPV